MWPHALSYTSSSSSSRLSHHSRIPDLQLAFVTSRPTTRQIVRDTCIALAALVCINTAQASDYTFSPLRIGGAGWVTGISVHPTERDAVFVRTDVGGAYAWEAESESWRQLLVESAVQAPEPGSDYDVESIAVAPGDADTLYIAVGTSYGAGADYGPPGSILVSRDGGQSFTRSTQIWFMGGNLEGRQGGERLAVDPANPRRVLFGSRREGLWQSNNGGKRWRQLNSLPVGETDDANAIGIKWVLFDPATAEGKRTRRVYASVSGDGIYRSNNGGRSWQRILASDMLAFDAEVAADSRLYVAFPGDSIRVYSPDTNTWSDISPNGAESYASVAVDPFDSDRVVVAADGLTFGRLWRTSDGGASWDTLDVDFDDRDVPWREQLDGDYYSVSSMAFDPVVPDRLWYPEGFGVYRSNDLNDNTVTWTLFVDGIEELVSNDVIAPAGIDPLTAHWDAALFRHPQPGAGTDTAILPLGGRFNSAWDLDYSAGSPRRVVATVYDHRFCCEGDGLANQSGYSNNGGRTWRRFSSLENGTHPEELRFGNIAVSSSNPRRIVWLPSFDAPLHYSRNGGRTWRKARIPGVENVDSEGSHFQIYLERKVLAADRVLPDTFYLYHDYLGALRSTDGGANWEVLGFTGLYEGAFFDAKLEAAPGQASDLWFAPGPMDGLTTPLLRSQNGGELWQAVVPVSNVEAIGFGPPRLTGDYPTLFIAGEVSGDRAIWRSEDEGASFQKVIDAPLGIYDTVTALSGDGDEFGTVYVGFDGVGFVVGRDGAIDVN